MSAPRKQGINDGPMVRASCVTDGAGGLLAWQQQRGTVDDEDVSGSWTLTDPTNGVITVDLSGSGLATSSVPVATGRSGSNPLIFSAIPLSSNQMQITVSSGVDGSAINLDTTQVNIALLIDYP